MPIRTFYGRNFRRRFFNSDIDKIHSKLYGIDNKQMISKMFRNQKSISLKSESECNLKDGFYYIYKYFINKISLINNTIGDNYNMYPIL